MSLNNTPMAGTQLNVMSGNFVTAQPLGIDDGTDYCHSGRIRRIDIESINRTLRPRFHCFTRSYRQLSHW